VLRLVTAEREHLRGVVDAVDVNAWGKEVEQ
jgi:hypothetical protein